MFRQQLDTRSGVWLRVPRWKVFNHGFLELHCLSFLCSITQRLGVCFSGSFTGRPNLQLQANDVWTFA